MLPTFDQKVVISFSPLTEVFYCIHEMCRFRCHFFANGEHVHPLPATEEDELGVMVVITGNHRNSAAGSGLHDADCSSVMLHCVVRMVTSIVLQ